MKLLLAVSARAVEHIAVIAVNAVKNKIFETFIGITSLVLNQEAINEPRSVAFTRPLS